MGYTARALNIDPSFTYISQDNPSMTKFIIVFIDPRLLEEHICKILTP